MNYMVLPMFHRYLLINIFLCTFFFCRADEDTLAPPIIVTWSGYVDGYYAFYTDSAAGTFQKFPTVSPKSEQFGLNVAMFSGQFESGNMRGLASVHFGDIPRSSWPSEYNNILEANAGIRILKKVWLDAGFFRSHLGAESLYPKDNIASTLALPTYHEAFYQAGLRLNYLYSDKLTANLYLLNGYNRFEDNNKKKSLGLLVSYTPNKKLNIGYANYFGDDTPRGADSISHFLFYNNISLNFTSGKIKVQAGFDIAGQKNSDTTGKKTALMNGALLSARYSFTGKCAIYARGETFNDEHGFLSGLIQDNEGKSTGMKVRGLTLGAEYKPADKMYFRMEGRQLMADNAQQIFRWEGWNQNQRLELMAHMGVFF